MSRPVILPRRSAKEWGLRIILALLALLTGIAATRYTLASALVRTDPGRAHQMAPRDGLVAGALASKLFAANQKKDAQAEISKLARFALQQEPTAVEAVATLGLQSQVQGDAETARKLFSYSQTLSRRHLGTHLWAIEDAVARNDIPEALRHYDVALRTSKGAPEILFPVLTAAISERAVRYNVIKVLLGRPLWSLDFIRYVAAKAPEPSSAVILLEGLRRVMVPIPPEATAAMINSLIAAGDFEKAWNFYSSARQGATRAGSRDPRFTAELAKPSVFDWVPVNDANISTSLQPRRDGGVFSFSAPATVGGILLRQRQLLPPGTYKIAGRTRDIEQPDRSRPYWVLSCQSGRELGRVAVPNSSAANGRFAGTFDVPADCPMQTLALVARPSDEIVGVAGQVEEVRLAPVE